MHRSVVLALAIAGCNTDSNPDDITLPETEPPVTFELESVGPTPEQVEDYKATLLQAPEVALIVGDHHANMLHFELLPEQYDELDAYLPGTGFEALVYDYEVNQNYLVSGDIESGEALTVVPTDRRPAPSLDEWQEAVDIALEDPEIAEDYAAGRIRFFTAMPPLIDSEDGDRVISFGIRDIDVIEDSEIVGVNVSAGYLIRYPDRAPPTAKAIGFVCNPPPDSFQSGSGRGQSGWARLRMRRGGTDLWSMYVRRPSSSGGTDGSGVELFNVQYDGKRILDRAHMPILNVIYENNACGPYRDWQWAEDPFQIGPVLANMGPGIVVTEWAKTIRELRDDSGNFNGVAIYWDNAHDEAVVLSELTAGWYRYMSEWRFGLDGTMSPRFGFDAVENGCTCRRHTHHGYWRMDFNVGNGGNSVEEYDGSAWVPQSTEFQQVRDDANGRSWRVNNPTTGDMVTLETSGPEDDPGVYGIADVWAMVDYPDEIDDSNAPPAAIPTQARIPAFVDGESIVDEDVVMWWAGHFVHDDGDPATNQTHTVKFTITPNW
jgi:hypothetical protein